MNGAVAPGGTTPRAGGTDVPPGTLIDHFRVRRRIGEGAHARVYVARDTVLGRRVALKLMKRDLSDPAIARELLEEARVTARFSHPNIVVVHAVGEYLGQPYLALEYLEGETLRRRISRGVFTPLEAARIARAICGALAEAHAHAVVHADLKPENIIVPRDGRLRVLDFGLARIIGGAGRDVGGTPAYMAPETWRGEPVTPAADIWALGVIFFELLTGRRPIADGELRSFAFRPAPITIPEPLASSWPKVLLAACLQLDPAARPRAEVLLDELDLRLEGGGGATMIPEAPPFRGLAPFAEADARDYFGRTAELEAFLERAHGQAFLAVVGPSGIGKSSFVQAGVLPRLRERARLTVLRSRPGATPFESLAALLTAAPASGALTSTPTPSALSSHAPSSGPAPAAEEPVRALAAALRETAGRLGLELHHLAERTGTQVVLFVDQLEEIFTLGAGEAEAIAFADALATAADDPSDPVRVILTVREDYLSHCANSAAMRRALGNLTVLAALSAEDLEEAIRRPVARAGYRFDDPELPRRIAAEVEGLPAGLPLLQFACRALWERRDKEQRLLVTRDYEAMGGVAGALARHGQELLAQLDEAGVKLARAMLLRLVGPDGTRRPRTRAEMLAELSGSAGAILDRLVESRLLVGRRDHSKGQMFVELAHESLARTWPALARWIEETREDRLTLQELEQAAALWESRGRRPEETWTGKALAEALQKSERLTSELPASVRDFLESGRRREKKQQRSKNLSRVLVIAALSLVVTAGIEFRRQVRESAQKQELAVGDMGRFQLTLAPFDWDADRGAPRLVNASTLQLKLRIHTPARDDLRAPGPEYSPQQLRRGAPRYLDSGEYAEIVEARSGVAFIEVTGRGLPPDDCGPSWIRLQQLPGFADRTEPPSVLRLSVPTCQATRGGTVEVPGGSYYRGGLGEPPVKIPSGNVIEQAVEPEREVEVSGFRMDRFEVTNAQYRAFAESSALIGERQPNYPGGEFFRFAADPRAPVTGINALTAEAYCRFMGKGLPSEDEWKKAVRGGIWLDTARTKANPEPRRNVPWGAKKVQHPTNLFGKEDGFAGIAPVGSFPDDRSPYDIYDLAGNAAEWTSSASRDPGLEMLRSVEGSHWDMDPKLQYQNVGWSDSYDPLAFSFSIGFRCREAL